MALGQKGQNAFDCNQKPIEECDIDPGPIVVCLARYVSWEYNMVWKAVLALRSKRVRRARSTYDTVARPNVPWEQP